MIVAYLLGPLHWYWYTLSVAVALVMGFLQMSAPGALVSSFFDLAYGNLIVFHASIVMAGSQREAILALDEWDAADPSWLTPMDACLGDFRLNSRGEIELAQFGNETANFVWEKCYPVLDGVRTRRLGDRSRTATEEIKRAVKHERNRLRGNRPPALSATTEVGRELQQRRGRLVRLRITTSNNSRPACSSRALETRASRANGPVRFERTVA